MQVSDNELLAMYSKSRDQLAFEALMRRHSAMVLGVCRNMLWHSEDVEDAFQSVFVLLSLKATKLLTHNSVGGWLHEATVRICLNLRRKNSRSRSKKMEQEPVESYPEPWRQIAAASELELLHKEISRLPSQYREAVVLCHLEGKSRAQAASILDCTTASVKAALARGRKMLRQRLIRHGIAASSLLSVAAVATVVQGTGLASATGAAATATSAGTASAAALTEAAVTESLIQSTLNVCASTTGAAGISNAAGPVVYSLIQKELAIMNAGILQSLFAVAATVATVCTVALAVSAGEFDTADRSYHRETRTVEIPDLNEGQPVDELETPFVNASVNVNDATAGPQEDDHSRQQGESNEDYIIRLNQDQTITDQQRDDWEAGQTIEFEATMPVVVTRTETRTRTVPVTVMKLEVRDGETVQVPEIKNVEQNYTVQVPYTELRKMRFRIPGNGNEENDTLSPRKASNETWQEYVNRLHELEIITGAQKSYWESGEEVVVEDLVSETKLRRENRTRVVPVTRMKVEIRDGKEVRVPVTEEVEQTYQVQVPVNVQSTVTLVIPAKGTVADDAETSGFVDSDGKPIPGKVPLLPADGGNPEPANRLNAARAPNTGNNPGRPNLVPGEVLRPGALVQSVQVNTDPAEVNTTPSTVPVSAKRAYETWQEYVTRLHEHEIISTNEMNDWNAGEEILIEKGINRTSYRDEVRTMQVPVQRIRKETVDGVETDVPYTENVVQNYTVNIPYQEVTNATLRIPARGELEDRDTTTGFLDEEGEPIEPVERPQNLSLAPPEHLSQAMQMSDSHKRAHESWESYVDRLHSIGLMDDNELEAWNSGQAVNINSAFGMYAQVDVQRVRRANVVRMVVTEVDGAQVAVPRNEESVQTYKVREPFLEQLNVKMLLPAKGELPEDATNEGFVLNDGTLLRDAKRPLDYKVCKQTSQETTKRASETWESYATHLYTDGYLTDEELEAFKNGESIKAEITRSVIYPKKQGDKVQVVRHDVKAALRLPSAENRSDDDTNSGFVFQPLPGLYEPTGEDE